MPTRGPPTVAIVLLWLLVSACPERRSGALAPTSFQHEGSFASSSEADASTRIFEVYEGPLRNPERGLVQSIDIFDADDVLFVQSQEVSLGFAQISLAAFRSREIDSRFMAQLREGFEEVRRAGLKLVLRFQYDTHHGQDAPLNTVLQHIDQLAPVLADNADVIAVLQAGFVGAWGEWHSSKHGLDATKNRQAILRKLLDVFPEHRKLQVRSPVFKEQALQGSAASSPEDLAAERIGYHNDCLLADESDRGTYPQPVEKWRHYLRSDRADVPVGGETCQLNTPRTNCGHAIYELRQQRWSFVNRTYHPDVIATWKAQGCLGVIDRDLGYRFALSTANIAPTLTAGTTEILRIEIENLGYAVPYNARPVYAVLSSSANRYVLPLVDWDPQTWLPDGVKVLEAKLLIPDAAPPGTYSLSLWLPDGSASLRERPEYAIRLANEGVWDAETGLNRLGDITVE